MPQIKISELPIMEELDGSDVLAGVDVSEQETKKTSINTILDYVNKNSDYKKLNNKPKINDVELNGNISLDDLNIPNKKLIKNITPKQDVEGTDNTFEDGLDCHLLALGGDGESQQVTTTGKQLFDNNKITRNKYLIVGGEEGTSEVFGISDYILIKSNTNYTLSNLRGNNVTACFYDNNKDYISDIGIYANDLIKTFTTPDNAKYFRFSVIIQETNSGYNLDKVQLEEGSEATNYEPYTGGQPSPSPDYEQPINSIEGSLEFTCRGKNLLNASDKLNSLHSGINILSKNQTLHFSGKAESQYLNSKIVNFDETLTSGTSFYFSVISDAPSSIKFKLWGYDSKGEFVNSFNTYSENVITPDRDIVKWSLVCEGMTKNNTYDFDVNIILTRGVEKTDWEPYVEPNKVTFNLGEEKLRSIENVKDELVVDLDTGDYYKVENIGEDILDGDENWEFSAFTNAKILSVFLNRGDMKPTSRFQMDNFKYSTGVSVATNYEYCSTGGNSIRIGIDKTRLVSSDIVGFKQWLSTHNTVVDFVLQKPTTKKLGTLSAEDLAKLKTFKGYNNVTVNTNLGLMNIRFTYGLDIKKYVDNKIAELSAQLIRGE